MTLMRKLLLISVVCLISCGGSEPVAEEEKVAAEKKTKGTGSEAVKLVEGVDISHYSGEIHWQDVKNDGYDFVFIKATEGNDWQDPMFEANMAGAKERGVIRGAYHFYVTVDDPKTQAQNFIDTVVLLPGDLPPVVDIEVMKGDAPGPHDAKENLSVNLRTFLDLLEQHYRVTPIIYTGPNFWEAHIGEGFGSFPIWVAETGVDEPRLPASWSRYTFWQFAENQSVKGITKDVDLNRFNGDLDELKAFCYQGNRVD